jgi:hypothetical protein
MHFSKSTFQGLFAAFVLAPVLGATGRLRGPGGKK